MMEKLWLIGIFTALSSFGIKTGLGSASIIYNNNVSLRKKIIFLTGAFLSYLLLFFILYLLTGYFQLLNYFDYFLNVLHYGMLIHILFTAGIFYWGIKLLINRSKDATVNKQKGVFLLITPCPVCIITIFLTLSLSYSLLTFSKFYITGLLFLIFLSFSILIILITYPFRNKIGTANTSFLGITMVIIAIYFFLIISVAPIYEEAKEIYKITFNTMSSNILDLKSLIILLITTIILLGIGIIIKLKK